MSTRDILVEVGAEEIPHRFIPDAVTELRARVVALMAEQGLAHERLDVHATPRRFSVVLHGAAARQADRVEEVIGPPVEAAFRDGVATKAAEGFAKKCGVEVGALQRKATDKGERVAAVMEVPGRSLEHVLGEKLPAVFETLPWPKNMRWGDGRRSWVRPVHWIVALSGSETFEMEAFGIRSGRLTRGHRTLHVAPASIDAVAEYLPALRRIGVIADRAERTALIRQGLAKAAAALEATVLADEPLVEACCDLVEWPVVVAGSFPPSYLELPDVVLSTAMRVHQKFFALTDRQGKLLPRFLHVAGKDDPEHVIARNNGAVLAARLDDATFYWKADLERPMLDRVQDLSRVLFQEKLGSYLDKTRRMEALALHVVQLLDPVEWTEDREVGNFIRAVELCKADQTTHVVKEFTELQGIMGGIYLREEGAPEATWRTVEEHYLPQSLTDPVPFSRYGAVLSLVDKLDTLVGCFGVGLMPTGSKDPFGLRRAAQGLVRTLLECDLDVSVLALIAASSETYASVAGFDAARASADLIPYLEGRLRFLLTEGTRLAEGGASFPANEVASAVGAGWDRVPQLLARLRALHAVRGTGRRDDFEALSVSFKRVRNILKGQPVVPLDAGALTEPEELALLEAVRGVAGRAQAAGEDWHARLEALASLRPHVDRFFEKVLVMAEDPALRAARMALLREIETLFLAVADISEIASADPRATAGR